MADACTGSAAGARPAIFGQHSGHGARHGESLSGVRGLRVAMAILKRRSRPVTFRISSDEYDALAAACLQVGARSVSEFSRMAVLRTVRGVNVPEGTISGDLANLSKRLGELDVALLDVRRRIRGVLGYSADRADAAAFGADSGG